MEIIRDKEALKQAIRRLRRDGKSIGLVPTMGALHAGHMALVAAGRRLADAVIVSIFVNPAQFGPNEDFARYPRSEDEDCEKLAAAGARIAYLPTVEAMYLPGAETRVTVGQLGQALCGATRPGHFDGVATIVTKFLLQVLPDSALFGEKDFQQLHIIRRVVRDLDIPVSIHGVPVLREADGLAMSSRNRYLSETERSVAPILYRILSQTAEGLRAGDPVEAALERAENALLQAGFARIDYIALRDARTLTSMRALSSSARLLAAAVLGTTRLIDNISV